MQKFSLKYRGDVVPASRIAAFSGTLNLHFVDLKLKADMLWLKRNVSSSIGIHNGEYLEMPENQSKASKQLTSTNNETYPFRSQRLMEGVGRIQAGWKFTQGREDEGCNPYLVSRRGSSE